jgi:hypothetical protein
MHAFVPSRSGTHHLARALARMVVVLACAAPTCGFVAKIVAAGREDRP